MLKHITDPLRGSFRPPAARRRLTAKVIESRAIDSLLLGLYDKAGLLHYVGRARLGADAETIVKRVKPLLGRGGFTGRAPGGLSRWSRKDQAERKTVPMKPVLVAEVSADRIENQRFRHGARLLRFRDDKKPERCTIDQIGTQ